MSTLLLSVAVISAAVTQAAAFQISMDSLLLDSEDGQATCEVGADPPPPMMAIVALNVLSVMKDAAMARKELRSI